jgi:hypothetical protein
MTPERRAEFESVAVSECKCGARRFVMIERAETVARFAKVAADG